MRAPGWHSGAMTARPDPSATDALAVLDWRRQTAASYREVRRLALDDPAAAHRGWVERRDALFAAHPASPLLPADRAQFTGLPVPTYDEAFRFEVELEEAEPATFSATTGTDGLAPFTRLGSVRLGTLGSLDVWLLRTYGGGLFVPVKDALAGARGGTYGGGRYVLDTIKGADLGADARGRLIVDLNFAFNPSCAYDPDWACPLAPPGNVVAVQVPVGERMPVGTPGAPPAADAGESSP